MNKFIVKDNILTRACSLMLTIGKVFLFFNEQTPPHLPGIRHTILEGSRGQGDLHAEVPRKNTLCFGCFQSPDTSVGRASDFYSEGPGFKTLFGQRVFKPCGSGSPLNLCYLSHFEETVEAFILRVQCSVSPREPCVQTTQRLRQRMQKANCHQAFG